MWWRLLIMPAYNMVEGIVDACRDHVEPEIGSILYCDLAFGYMDHSGVYIGNNEIVHLSGKGNIEVVSPKQFIDGGSACSIYVSCKETWSVGSEEVAERAKSMIGRTRGYNFLFDNCHQFSAGCLTGDFDNSCNFLWMLKDESAKRIGSDNWRFWDIELFD
ncbi:lecithin retinol acyltransferase family protein [Aeromonas veronii]|uniref:lecithin retinol acyltransferase family protein n=1 Tax=Aeromonas veronii TaxID=654 RepID=UPI003D1C0E91